MPCTCRSNGTAAKKTPVMPPSENKATNPTAKSIAVVKWILPPQSVATHEKIFTPVGIAIVKVRIMNGNWRYGARPEVNMWCAQTMKPASAIAIDENAISL